MVTFLNMLFLGGTNLLLINILRLEKAFLDWVAAGKPHHGMLNEIIRRTRSQFKLALRYCKQLEMTLRADALAITLCQIEYRKFWKSVNRSNNNKAVKYGSTIDGCSGDNDIHRMTLTSL